MAVIVKRWMFPSIKLPLVDKSSHIFALERKFFAHPQTFGSSRIEVDKNRRWPGEVCVDLRVVRMDQNNDMPRTVLNQFIKTVQEKTERAALSRGEGFGLFVGRRIPTVKNLDQVAFNDL